MHPVNANLTVDVLQDLMIRIQYKLPLNQVVLPMLKSLYYSKELQLIGRPFTSSFTNFLTKECYWTVVLSKNNAYPNYRCITLHLKHLLEVGQCQNRGCA